jgi:hypothetical protein
MDPQVAWLELMDAFRQLRLGPRGHSSSMKACRWVLILQWMDCRPAVSLRKLKSRSGIPRTAL